MKKLYFCVIVALLATVLFTSCEKDHNTETGVVIDGIRWATRNVDFPGTFADAPESAGKFYQWNRKTAWITTGSVAGWDASDAEGNTWKRANDPCPQGWRVPTENEFIKLINSGNEWVTFPVNGYLFGSGNNTIFLPAVGFRHADDGALDKVDSNGLYWSSSLYLDNSARGLGFGSGGAEWEYYGRGFGLSVRCVAE